MFRIYFGHLIDQTRIVHQPPRARQNRSLLVFLQNNQGVRQFPLQHAITASHLFTLISNMHFYQATAELCAPHAAGLLEKIGMFNCEINILTELAMQTNITLFSMQMRCTK